MSPGSIAATVIGVLLLAFIVAGIYFQSVKSKQNRSSLLLDRDDNDFDKTDHL